MKVLYVEDDPLDAELTRRELLKTAPLIRLDVVSTLRDAMVRLEQAPYEMVLTDMRLQDGDGLALLAHIRERDLPIAVTLITGSGDEETAVAALKAGADDYLVKRAGYHARLPLTLENALERHRAETARRARPLHVLYAEDNAVDIDLTRRHLARHAPFIYLDAVSTAAQVLERVEQFAVNGYDVLLLDYQLPDANGLELLRELRQGRKLDIPVVLVTGQGNEELAVQSLRLGAADYVVKTSDYLYKLPWALENAFHRVQLAHEQAALRESEARYRLISELTSDITYAFRVGPDGAFALEWNAGALGRMAGYTWQGLEEGKNLLALVYPDDLPVYQAHLAAVLAGQSDVVEFRIIAKDGDVRWVRDYARPVWDEAAGRVVRFYGAAQDITERRHAEEEVKRLNQDLERRARELAALNQAGRAITSTLKLEAVLKLVIGEVKSLLNVEGTSVLLRDPSSDELVFAASTGAGSEGLVGTRIPITVGIAGWVARERKSAWVTDAQHDSRFYGQIDAVTSLTTRSLLAVPLVFKGVVWGVVEALNKTDGTFSQRDCEVLEALASSAAIAIENAQLYTSLQESNTRLQTALKAKDDMIRNVSHELRTPLGLIYGYIKLMETGDLGPLTAKQERAVQTLRQQGDRLRFMVERLLALQTLDPEKMRWEQVDLSQWLRQAMRPWEARIAKSKAKIELQLDVPPSLPPLIADPDFMGQIIGNLLDNAVKFSPQGGQVRVSAWTESGQVIMAVSDHGIGIPPDKLQQIFERFYQVDASSTRRYGGMGIGLALCRAIAEAHGGRVWAESAGNGQGSTFYVALPMMTTSGNVV